MSTDNRTELNDCELIGGWSDTVKTPAVTNLAGQFYEGSNSIEVQHSNANAAMTTTQESVGVTTFSLDWSNTTFYLLLKDNLVQDAASGGVQLVIGDGTDLIGFDVGGKDSVGMPISPFYNVFKLDVSNLPAGSNVTYTGVEGNLTLTTITEVGVGTIHAGKASGNVTNLFLDYLSYLVNTTAALTINGGTVGTPETMVDVQGDDVAGGWGLVANPFGSQFLFIGATGWGNNIDTADSFFQADDEQWYWLGFGMGVGKFVFSVVGHVDNTNSFVLNGVVIVSIDTPADFNMSDTDIDTLKLTGCTFTDLSTMTLQAQDAGNKFLSLCIFNNCAKLIPVSMDLDDVAFNGTTDADGAILLNEDADTIAGTMTNLTFTSDGTGHAVHIRPTGAGPFAFDLDNWNYSGYANDGGTAGNREVFINPVTGSVDITLNIQNGGTSPSTDQTGYTGTLTINNSVTIRVEGLTEGAACKCVADETLGTLTIGDTIFELLADANGVAELTTFNYEAAFGAGLDVIIRTGQQGLPNAAQQSDNGSFTDETTASNSTTIDDMNLFPATAVVNEDSFYFGHFEKFPRIKIELTDLGVGGFGITWEYWTGSVWSSLSATDGTSNFTVAGEQVVSWTIPGDWATSTEGGLGPYFYVRARFTSGTMSTNPTGRKAQLDVTRYLTAQLNRTVVSTGLTTTANHVVDTIANFISTD